MAAKIYAGPGKVFMSTKVLWPEGENGAITAAIEQETVDVVSGFHGRQTSLQGGMLAKISLTPFDSWGSLGLLYPASIGVSVGATAGVLAIGTQPHGAADVPCKIWTPDGRLYNFARAAVTKHPDLHLGIDKALFGDCEITALIAAGKKLGDAGAFYTITETGGADPGGVMSADYVRGAWTGVWGTADGFGGEAEGTPIEAEEEWTISCEVKYQSYAAQKLVRAMTLTSVKFMARVRPFGPTQTQIDAIIGARMLGAQVADGTTGKDLVLTGPNTKTITLKNTEPVGAGFEFGGSKLGNGEIGFLSTMTFTAGAAQPLLIFSA